MILINGEKLIVANVGDSRAILCKNGATKAMQIMLIMSHKKRGRWLRGEEDLSYRCQVHLKDWLLLYIHLVWKLDVILYICVLFDLVTINPRDARF